MQTSFSETRAPRETCSRGRGARNFLFCAALIPICIVSVIQWRMVRQSEIDADLKRELLERGLSVSEVERIVQAGQPAWNNWDKSMWTVEHAKIESNLKRELAQMGLSADEIDRVVKSSSGNTDSARGKSGWETVDRANKDAAAKKDMGRQIQANRTSDYEAAVRELMHRGYSMEEVQRLLRTPSKNAATEAGGSTVP